jgi:cupin fold WbuC family metalloprotein
MLRFKQTSDEVLFGDEPVIKVGHAEIQWLKQRAEQNPRKRIRLCAHKDVDHRLHEMLIVHTRETYVRPHKHLTKNESFHVVEGCADVVIFDDTGNVVEVIRMGDYSSGRMFYYRISEPCYHTLVIRSEFLVFHETANGPFKRTDTVPAPWAPGEDDITAQKEFIERISQTVDRFRPYRLERGE